MATIEETQILLLQAETAYHAIMMGKSVREVVDQNGEKVVYNAANSTKLLQYIQQLKRLIAGTTSGPLRVIF